MKLRARWTGHVMPSPGDYLASTIKPNFAYRVTKVTPVGEATCLLDTRQQRLVLEVDRVPIDLVPAGVRVYPWRWDKRSKRIP